MADPPATSQAKTSDTTRCGDIHFEDGDHYAREAAAGVGKQAWAKALTYLNGTVT